MRERATAGVRKRAERAAFALAAVILSASCSADPSSETPWVTSWATSAYDPGPNGAGAPGTTLGNVTIRNMVTATAGGEAARVIFSNREGAAPLFIGAATLGRQARGAAADSIRSLTFGGADSAMVAPGGEIASDAVALQVEPGARLAITLYVAEDVAPPTMHATAWRTSFISEPGDFARSGNGDAFTSATGAWLFATALDVANGTASAVVAIGDSITEGYGATADADRRWTDFLAHRLSAGNVAVLNAGINGNLLLGDSPCFGRAPLTRWEDDIAKRRGVAAVILLAGTNDLIQPTIEAPDNPCLSRRRAGSGDMIAAYQTLAARARAEGLRLVIGTLPPFGNLPQWSPEIEAVRTEVNDWIRRRGGFDAVADFDKALADPADPAKLAQRFDSGDGLHPNDAGAEAMAMAVDLSVFPKGRE